MGKKVLRKEMRITVFTLTASLGPWPYDFILPGLIFFSYQIKLCASSCSATTFYNSQIWYSNPTHLLRCKFSGISPFLYIFPLAVASNSNSFKLMRKVCIQSHSLFSRIRTPSFSTTQTWKSVILVLTSPSSSTSNHLQNTCEFFISISLQSSIFLFPSYYFWVLLLLP